MKFNPDIHRRRSIRLKGHDYSDPGAYFVTVCVQSRLCLFGDILDHVMMINAAGTMIGYWWNELLNKFPNVKLDKYVVMPNHLHGIIEIRNNLGQDHGNKTNQIEGEHDQDKRGANIRQIQGAHAGAPLHVGVDPRVYPITCIRVNPLTLDSCLPDPPGAPLDKIIQWFKTMTTNEYIRNERQNGWPPFDKKLWQRNYYEHFIRGHESLNEIREYIVNNPKKWKDDEMFPEQTNN